MNRSEKTIAVLIVALTIALSLAALPAAAFTVIDGEYKLPAKIDSSVATEEKTELWAHVWRPKTGGPYPLVVFLHGNHGTCGRYNSELGVRVDDRVDYTTSGKCPSGYVVTPSHTGYAYLAQALAAHGYVVVSINANRGVTAARSVPGDYGLNLRRGRLVLRHLQELAKWNVDGGAPASLGFPLKGLIDFTQVGLMGHSRGGEGMRAAVAQFNDSGSQWPSRIQGLKFRSLFEIGPVDGQTSRTLNASGLVWNVLLPGCDGDVSDLQGLRPFDRMLQDTTETRSLHKSTFQVFGANHNFYNTEWQMSDAMGCVGQTAIFPQLGGSPAQLRTALGTLVPFFLSNLGEKPVPSLARRFDPSYPVPLELALDASYARGFTWSPRSTENFVVDNFDKATGISSSNVRNQFSGLSQYKHGEAGEDQDPTQRAAAVDWTGAGGFLQVNAAPAGQGVDVSRYHALEFRVTLRCFDDLCSNPADSTGGVDFSISLVDADGFVSEPVSLKSVVAVRRPAGAYDPNWICNNEVFQTVRITLSAFVGVELSRFRGVRFTFDRSRKSSIFLANVRLTRAVAGSLVYASTLETQIPAETMVQTVAQSEAQSETNEIVAIRRLSSSGATATQKAPAPSMEIEVASTRLFPVSDALPTLVVGDKTFKQSCYPSGSTDRLVFILDASDFAAIEQGTAVSVRIGGASPWDFGKLDKSLAR